MAWPLSSTRASPHSTRPPPIPPRSNFPNSLAPIHRVTHILDWQLLRGFGRLLPPKADPFGDDYWFDAEIYNKVDVGGVALEWNKDLPNDDVLTFINAWRRYESDSAYDGDFTAYDAVTGSTDLKFDQYTSELRVTSPGGATLDYQGGLYAFYSEMDSTGTI